MISSAYSGRVMEPEAITGTETSFLMASAVNASRIQVARICSRLQKEGVIRTRRGRVFILDEAALGEAQPYP